MSHITILKTSSVSTGKVSEECFMNQPSERSVLNTKIQNHLNEETSQAGLVDGFMNDGNFSYLYRKIQNGFEEFDMGCPLLLLKINLL